MAIDERGSLVHNVLVPESPEDDALHRRVGEEDAQHGVVVVCPYIRVLLPHVQLGDPNGQSRLRHVVQVQL